MYHLDVEGVGVHIHPGGEFGREACTSFPVQYHRWPRGSGTGDADRVGLPSGNCGEEFRLFYEQHGIADYWNVGPCIPGRLGGGSPQKN